MTRHPFTNIFSITIHVMNISLGSHLNSKFSWRDHYKIMHMAQQLCCHAMSKMFLHYDYQQMNNS